MLSIALAVFAMGQASNRAPSPIATVAVPQIRIRVDGRDRLVPAPHLLRSSRSALRHPFLTPDIQIVKRYPFFTLEDQKHFAMHLATSATKTGKE